MSTVFPFTAIVRQERMKRALVLNAIDQHIGGVLIRGERGTGKSTAARALAALLPEIEVVADCLYSCDPGRPDRFCDDCRRREASGETLPTARRQIRFVDLPVSATEDRVVGTLDMERAIKRGERRFEPGVLASANRGLLYVDEVNLLDDHVVDLLLDSAAMGTNVVEREGISFSHPSLFILVGTMNPEEGDLRPQLTDRFGLCVDIRGIADPRDRAEILERRVEFERDPVAFGVEWETEEAKLASEIADAREIIVDVEYSDRDLDTIARLAGSLEVDGHRADIVILKAGLAHAALQGRRRLEARDILVAAEVALAHRLKKHPLEDGRLSRDELRERLEEIRRQPRPDPGPPPSPGKRSNRKKVRAPEAAGSTREATPRPSPIPWDEDPAQAARRAPQSQDQPVRTGRAFRPRRLETPLDRKTRRAAGRRSKSRVRRKRGRYVLARPMGHRVADIAFDATLRQSAPHQRRRRRRGDVALVVKREDLQRKVRMARTANLIMFVVDASWSMAAAERMVATKGAILSLLRDAYQRRDWVGLIVFRKNDAALLLPPTNSVKKAEQILADIPVGGKTPLSRGLYLAYQVITRERRRAPTTTPLLIVLTDGAGNVSMGSLSPREESRRMARLLRESDVSSVVINTEHRAFDRGLAEELAVHLGGRCWSLSDLGADRLYQAVRRELES